MRRHTGEFAVEALSVTSPLAPGQEPADPRRVIAAFQNLAAIERLARSTPGGWHPKEDDPLAPGLRQLAIAGLVELNPMEIPGAGGVRRYDPEFTALGSLTVFEVLSVARTEDR